MLYNNYDHDMAYNTSTLNTHYERCENAIGYTPDDIIMFKTINDYYIKAIPNATRSKSVMNIDRSLPIVAFDV